MGSLNQKIEHAVKCNIFLLFLEQIKTKSEGQSEKIHIPNPDRRVNSKIINEYFFKIKNIILLQAIYCLTNNDWKLDIASDNYFQNPDAYFRELDRKKIEQLFQKYRDPNDSNKISSDGVVSFLEDLQLSPESRLVLIIAWKFRAQNQCEFTRDEFVSGLSDLGVDSIDKLKSKLTQLEHDLQDLHKFKDFYQYTFNYAKETGQKGLDLDMAIAYWNIVLKDRFKFLDMWCKFLMVSSIINYLNEGKVFPFLFLGKS